jgi:hypothetical protein
LITTFYKSETTDYGRRAFEGVYSALEETERLI